MNFRKQSASGRFQPFTLRKIRQNKRRGRLDVGPADVSCCVSSRTGTTSFQPFVPGEHWVAPRRGEGRLTPASLHDGPRGEGLLNPGRGLPVNPRNTAAEVSFLGLGPSLLCSADITFYHCVEGDYRSAGFNSCKLRQ